MNSIFSRPIAFLVFIFETVASVIGPLLKFIYTTAVFVLYVPLELALRFTPLDLLIRRITHEEDPLAKLDSESEILARNRDLSESEAEIVGGKRLEYIERKYPRSKFPFLYQDVPEDLVRSIVSDGRMPNGIAPAIAMAGLSLTPEFIKSAWTSSTKIAVRAAYVIVVVSVVMMAGMFSFSISRHAAIPADTQQATKQPPNIIFLASRYADIWTMEQAVSLTNQIGSVEQNEMRASKARESTRALVQQLVMFALLTIATLIFALASARLVWIGRFRYLVFSAADGAVSGLRSAWREALQRWRWRLPEREMELSNYIDQVKFATTIDKSPLLDIGVSLGLLEHRGHLLAPAQGQPVRMSVVDLLQHIEVLGGSGEGKSRNFYVPLVKQLIDLRLKGYPIAVYATDDKGAIGADILELAQAAGLPESEVLLIGTGPNDYRVDLIDGLQPVELADMIKSVAAQAGGESGGDFWPEMASDLLLQVATVLQAAECTSAGEKWVIVADMRMYSLLNILRVASSDQEIERALEMVIDALQDKDEQYRRVAHLDKNGLHAAIEYLVDNWLNMVDATKDGIRANARKSLRSFAFKDEIARGFADGAGDKLISAKELLSNKVKIINISQIEHGSAGRMVSILLKTLLFKQARQSEQKDPLFAKKRLAWWFNPQLGPDCEKYAINVFLADEYQGLVTSSRDDGLSDASVWNVLRSAGIAGVLLSQSVSAFRMAIGDKATDNMRRNWRTKIVLRTEDLATIDDAKKLAGKTMRFHSMDWNHLESSVAVRRETGISADSLEEVHWNTRMDDIPLILTPGHFSPFTFVGYDEAYEVDDRFIPDRTSPLSGAKVDDGNAILAAKQMAVWRQEDRSAGILQHGISEVDAVRDEDLMEMGRARALVFVQRAGGTRVEFVKLNG